MVSVEPVAFAEEEVLDGAGKEKVMPDETGADDWDPGVASGSKQTPYSG